jgi:hypothetical protein
VLAQKVRRPWADSRAGRVLEPGSTESNLSKIEQANEEIKAKCTSSLIFQATEGVPRYSESTRVTTIPFMCLSRTLGRTPLPSDLPFMASSNFHVTTIFFSLIYESRKTTLSLPRSLRASFSEKDLEMKPKQEIADFRCFNVDD